MNLSHVLEPSEKSLILDTVEPLSSPFSCPLTRMICLMLFIKSSITREAGWV